MKLEMLLLLVMLIAASCGGPEHHDEAGLQALYGQLDAEIAKTEEYDKLKNQRIAELKREALSGTDRQRTATINKLINEFNAYNADSTLYYIGYNLKRPDVKLTPGEHTRLLIKRADVFAHAGLFSDALLTIDAIPRDSLRPEVLEDYYSTYCAIYQYLSEFTSEHETASAYEKKRSVYADSLAQVIPEKSFNHMVYVMTETARRGDPDTAIKMLKDNIKEYKPGTREYSILASTLAYICKTAGDEEEAERYLVMSAISDVRGAVKENVSFREVATVRFEQGDVERANRYLKKSIADANFYSALMRNAQSTKMLPVIDDAYSSIQTTLNRRLRRMVWVSSVLSVVLLVTVCLMLAQFKSLRRANRRASQANEELSRLSERLSEANEELKGKNGELSKMSSELTAANGELAERNAELREFNRTKEQYAGLFMEYCSSAISSLQLYQQSLRNLHSKGVSREALQKKLESTEIADHLLKNFYVKFDEAILNIYPSFVEKFNQLLQSEHRIVLKNGELLNTELRLYALIRIGIDDSAKIADFLRCSISTIYTYRSKMRKRALNPEEFENQVRNLS